MLNGMLTGARLGRAIGLALPLGLFVLFWESYGDPGPVIRQTTVPGVVREVHPNAYLIELSDPPAQVRVLRTYGVEAGATVALTATTHTTGVVRYALQNRDGVPRP